MRERPYNSRDWKLGDNNSRASLLINVNVGYVPCGVVGGREAE